tara:strand:+ start:2482 stop:2694 length:213 start_codon:yes stop_codon:yes gene_type:complete
MEIDLHGFNHQQAVEETENFILMEYKYADEVKIITGNSKQLQDKIIEMLDKHGFRWYIPSWNLGVIMCSY